MAGADRIDALAAQVAAAMPELDPRLQAAALTLLRALAQGDPVDVRRLAELLALPVGYIDETLERSPGVFRDQQRRVTGFMGLSIIEVSEHRIRLEGRVLWARCAWDALFLPELVGQSAGVSSRCPSTGRSISLTVTPTGVTDLAPPEAVVSFLLPETRFDANVVQSFCRFVHLFASRDAAAGWSAEHPGTFSLAIDDAYRLGQLTNRATFGAALG